MTDRNQIMEALECCVSPITMCGECAYGVMRCMDLKKDVLDLLKEQEAEIRQLRLALDIAKGTCKGVKSGGGQFADMPTMQSAT